MLNRVIDVYKRYKKLGIISVVVVIVVVMAAIYFMMQPSKTYLVVKQKDWVVEYGNTLDTKLETYLDFKELDVSDKEDVLKHAKIGVDVKNEENKEYPAVGKYTVRIRYKEEVVESKIEVKDTIAPEFNSFQSVEFLQGTDFDYNKYVQATDLSGATIEYALDTVNKDEPGEYTVKMVASDPYQNKTEKLLSVKVIALPNENQEAKVIEDLENGAIYVEIKEKPKPVETPKPQVPNTPVSQPTGKVIEIQTPYINQYAYGAPMGCEGASLLQALQAKGYASGVSLKTILDTMPYTSDGNPHHGFVSSPYIVDDAMVYQSIFPSALTPFGSQYGTCVNTSGYTPAQLVEQLRAGNPSVVYVTYKFAYPKWDTYSFGKCTSNMHVMTLVGYNENTGQYKVMDPAGQGGYWISKSKFENAYNALRFSITVK